ncbi:MAG: bifunctional [glutamine synthetase] adenylyltransferase/[glutamine synthetase]-adenylyl-L-tyrosine phosphorylase [Pseudomonadota bacterium]
MTWIRPIGESPGAALAAASTHAPYLAQLQSRVPEAWETVRSGDVDSAYRAALDKTSWQGDPDQVGPLLRRAKSEAHLAIAAADLSRVWPLEQVTAAITDFADAALDAALRSCCEKRRIDPGGLFLVALGKMGAHELNYSSDIDVVALYDPHVFTGGERGPADAASRILKDVVALMEARTEDGYIFRTDLRLRPDPSSTPLVVSTRMAESYYESIGQNWERMAWIKARACAGDKVAAQAFLNTMIPFVWRRHLDYWAIADIHAIKRMINANAGESISDEAPDVKLGPGGIREIEFFVQTQQVILGGRTSALRARGTLDALAGLTEAGVVEAQVADDLRQSYETLRHVEHRIQMRLDEQSHSVPKNSAERKALAALSGVNDENEFADQLAATRSLVHGHYQNLFAEEDRRHETSLGNLVFTGVDDDPGTVATLETLGFSNPQSVIDTIRRWHRGGTPATRTQRGRELLTAVLPELLHIIGETGEADAAFARFGRFFEGLSSGVQVLSMLLAETDILTDLVGTLAIAPSLAQTLSRRPDLLEGLVDGCDPADPVDVDSDFETAMDAARRRHRDLNFLIGHRLLHGRLAAREAAAEYSDLADETIRSMAAVACKETERRFGPAPGHWSVMALGRLGGRDMTAGSDLDIMVLYEPFDEISDAQTWFSRFTQRLITALSAPTAEGLLYEVDMRLRPSGRAGPVAVQLSAFDRYHREEAWTWEHMSLTRLRFVAGDAELGDRISQIAANAIVHAGRPSITRDVADMRARLFAAKPPKGSWDLKLAPGGTVDIEFIVQHELLTARDATLLRPHTGDAIEALQSHGYFSADETALLCETFANLNALQQVLRLAVDGVFDPDAAPKALNDRLARAIGVDEFERVESTLRREMASVAALREKKLHMQTTE